MPSSRFSRFDKMERDVQLEVDDDKIKKDSCRDRLKGIVRNASDIICSGLVICYRELSMVE